jgi:hypothetical protein
LVLICGGVAYWLVMVQRAGAGLDDQVQQMQRFVAPGEATVRLDGARRSTLYYESLGEHEGRAFSTQRPIPNLAAALLDEDGRELGRIDFVPDALGVPRPVASGMMTVAARVEHYDRAGRSGHGLYRLDVPDAGTYTLQTTLVDPGERQYLMAVGRLPDAEQIIAEHRLFWVSGIAAGLGITGLLIAAMTWARRRQVTHPI